MKSIEKSCDDIYPIYPTIFSSSDVQRFDCSLDAHSFGHDLRLRNLKVVCASQWWAHQVRFSASWRLKTPIFWVVSNMAFIFHFILMGCHPNPIDELTPSFFKMVIAPPTSQVVSSPFCLLTSESWSYVKHHFGWWNHQTLASSIRIKLAFFPWWNHPYFWWNLIFVGEISEIHGDFTAVLVEIHSSIFSSTTSTSPLITSGDQVQADSFAEICRQKTMEAYRRRWQVLGRWRLGLSWSVWKWAIPWYTYKITIWLFNIAMENHGKSQFLIGKPSINGSFSMAMLNNQRVYKIAIS